MADNYIMVEGNRIDLTEDQVETLKNALNKNKDDNDKNQETIKSPFDRVDSNEVYYCIAIDGGIARLYEKHLHSDDCIYQIANYCTNKNLIQQQADCETLNRLLWRFTYQHGWNEDLWEDNSKKSI